MMSQQQGSQESPDQSTNEGEQWQGQAPPLQSPLPWLIQGKRRIPDGPKSDHPSTYDESIPPLSYRAQDDRQASISSSPKARESLKSGTSARVGEGARVEGRARVGGSQRVGGRAGVEGSQRVGASPTPTGDTGDMGDMGDMGYRQWRVPPWARPQRNNFGAMWLYVLVTMAILAFPMLCFLISVVVQFLALMILIVVGILLLTFTVFAIFWAMRKIDRMKPPFWW